MAIHWYHYSVVGDENGLAIVGPGGPPNPSLVGGFVAGNSSSTTTNASEADCNVPVIGTQPYVDENDDVYVSVIFAVPRGATVRTHTFSVG